MPAASHPTDSDGVEVDPGKETLELDFKNVTGGGSVRSIVNTVDEHIVGVLNGSISRGGNQFLRVIH